MPPKFVSLLVPMGAGLAVIFSSMTGYSMMRQIGSKMNGNPIIAVPDSYMLGVFGMLLFGGGITAVAWSPRRHSGSAAILFLGAMSAFSIAVIFIGLSCWELRAAFVNLATAATVEPDLLYQDVDMAWVPLVIGWGFVLGGAVLVCAADLVAERAPRPIVRFWSQRIAIAAALFALLTFILSGMWSVSSLRWFEQGLALPDVEPSAIAGAVIGMVNSTYIIVFGLMGCGFVSLLLAMSTLTSAPVEVATDREVVVGPG